MSSITPKTMTPAELVAARKQLGELYGLGRAVLSDEMGRLLRLAGKDPGQAIHDYERGKTRISGPISLCVEMLLEGGWRTHPIPPP